MASSSLEEVGGTAIGWVLRAVPCSGSGHRERGGMRERVCACPVSWSTDALGGESHSRLVNRVGLDLGHAVMVA
jgi:hypothetical protein